MKVLMFQPRFAPLVKAGTKRQTIRPKRNRPIKPGELLSLRQWQGKPYRSKQKFLIESTCRGTDDIAMSESNSNGKIRFVLSVNGIKLTIPRIEILARLDGFTCGFEMWTWFREEHGFPFRGDIIRW